jgi:hypothetical protein
VDGGFFSGVWQETYITNLRIKLWCGCWILLWSVAGNPYNKPEDKSVVWMLDSSLEYGRKPLKQTYTDKTVV